MPFWANAAKEVSLIPTSEKNLQKLGAKSLMEVSARIDFTESRYFTGENQDSFVFIPQVWTEVKGANGYTPTLSPSLIHFIKKEFKGFQGAVKEPTVKDIFFTTWLAKLMVEGKTYQGFIDISIPQAMIDLISANASNEVMIAQLLSPYINVVEVSTPTDALQSLSISSTGGNGFSGGGYGSKGESEADKIKARQETVKALVGLMYGDFSLENYRKALSDQGFITAASLELGLPLPSNLSLTF